MKMKTKRTALKWLRMAGYSCMLLQYLWSCVLFLPALLDSNWWVLTTPPASAPPVATVSVPDPVSWLVAGVIVAVVVGISLVFISRLPKTVARSSDMVVRRTTQKIVPIVIARQPVSVRTQRRISQRVMVAVKLALALVPIVLLYLARYVHVPLDTRVIDTVGWSLFIATLVCLSLHELFAQVFGVSDDLSR